MDEQVLLLDLGNSGLKAAWWQQGRWSEILRFGYADALKELFDVVCQSSPPSRVLVSSVAPSAVEAALTEGVRSLWGVTPRFAETTDTACGVTNGYRQPGELGVDRWMALIGAHHQAPSLQCVVDCGTAVTIDVLDAEGCHGGGMIIPGVSAMRRCLADHTGLVIEPEETGSFLGHGTSECVATGVVNAVASLVDSAARFGAESAGESARVVLTGGDAELIATRLDAPAVHKPRLVMDGLAVWAGLGI
ncbi:MAG: type III pantothenate kinase [Pseudomonadota bacterium]